MRGFKSIFVSSKHKINCFLIQEKYFQTANAVDTLPLSMGTEKTHGANGDTIRSEERPFGYHVAPPVPRRHAGVVSK